MLSHDQLKRIDSVACLKARQKDPHASCTDLGDSDQGEVRPAPVATAADSGVKEYLGLGNWPHWSDDRCHSHGQFLCDPENLLSEEAQARVAGLLKTVREQVKVKCGLLDSALGSQDRITTRPFNLGVVVSNDLPQSEADPGTLQKFGLLVMGKWGLMPIYNGVDSRISHDPPRTWQEYTSNCPNAALLIVLPEYDQVYLSAPSCEFICSERGGPEVTTRMHHALDAEKGIEAAVSVGIQETSRVLQSALAPLSMEEGQNFRERHSLRQLLKIRDKWWSSEEGWVLLQRVTFLGLFGLVLFAVASFMVYNLPPVGGLAERALRKV